MENPLKEFIYRKGIALKGDDREITVRLFGLVAWMETVPLLSPLLEKLRSEAGESLLQSALIYNNENAWMGHKIPPNAQSIEEIASVGLALLDEAKTQSAKLEKRAISEIASGFWHSGGGQAKKERTRLENTLYHF